MQRHSMATFIRPYQAVKVKRIDMAWIVATCVLPSLGHIPKECGPWLQEGNNINDHMCNHHGVVGG